MKATTTATTTQRYISFDIVLIDVISINVVSINPINRDDITSMQYQSMDAISVSEFVSVLVLV